jgi:preprotein translocase subunit SecD
VTEPVKFRDRTDPDTGKAVEPLKRVGPLRFYRPWIGLTLGLDLRGGSHLVLQVQPEGVFEFASPELAKERTEDERAELYAEIVELLSTEVIGTTKRDVELYEDRIRVRTRANDPDEVKRQADIIEGLLAERFPDIAPKVAELQPAPGKMPEALKSIREILERRVDAYGLTEPLIQEQRPDRIIVELPGVKDPEQAKEFVKQTATLQFRHIPLKYGDDNRRPKETEVAGRKVFSFTDRKGDPVPTAKVIEESEVVVTGRGLKPNSAQVVAVPGHGTSVTFELQGQAADDFADFTRKNVNHLMAIVLDNEMITCPNINEPIPGGNVEISGGFGTPEGMKEARNLKILLNAGALPLDLRYVEERTVSAQLGQDALVKSLWAGLVGLGVVLLFMALYYRLPGLLADVALVCYVILLMGAIKLVNQVLTLPGILAVILSIGMAVDANIIIFERLKEEIRTGKTMRSAVEAGFKRAWAAILDSNVCSVGTGIVLFYFGTGPIKGFAVALIIGVLVSLFTAVTVTRLFVNLVMRTGLARNLSLFGVAPSEVEGA